ncbi:MAG: SDR family oxidoreductase [Tatlockia sp.]|nr:SDR family oxidoreductase [Tatlockia sp.]
MTGANSGIGKEIALGLAKSGARVIMVCRNLKKGKKAVEEIRAASHSNSVELLIADLSSQKDVQLLAKQIYERYKELHVLINNAAVVLSKKKLSIDNIEMTLATNYLGPFFLTELLLDLLQKSAPSRIINISSGIHKWAKLDLDDLQSANKPYHFMRVYAQSKLLLTIYTYELAYKLERTGVTVNCVHPGAVNTRLGSDENHSIGLKLIDKMIKFFLSSPNKAAKRIIDLAISSEYEQVTGQYFVNGKIKKSKSSIGHDLILAKKILEITRNLIAYH